MSKKQEVPRAEHLLKLIEDLIEAAETGECPDPRCRMCTAKRETIARAKVALVSYGYFK